MTAPSATVASAVQRLGGLEALQLEMPPLTAFGNDLSGDHPLFGLDAQARGEVRAALDRGETHYADVPGIAPLRDAVAAALKETGRRVNASDGLVITAGEQEARFLALQTLAQAGYRIILPDVVHPGARKAAALGRVTVERLPLDPVTMEPDSADVRRVLALGKAALYLESPNRLTGKIVERARVVAVAEEILRAGAMVIWDAALASWVPEESAYTTIDALPGVTEHTVTLGTLWTGCGVEGWLAAYLAGPASLFEKACSLKQIIAICTTTPAQWGALGALRTERDEQRGRLDVLRRHKAEAVRQSPAAVLPGETASIVAVRQPENFAELSALPARPMPSGPFGTPGILRFTVTPTGEVVGALRALAAWRLRP